MSASIRRRKAAVSSGSGVVFQVAGGCGLGALNAGNGGLLEVWAHDPDIDFASIEVSWPGGTPVTKAVSGNDVETTISLPTFGSCS